MCTISLFTTPISSLDTPPVPVFCFATQFEVAMHPVGIQYTKANGHRQRLSCGFKRVAIAGTSVRAAACGRQYRHRYKHRVSSLKVLAAVSPRPRKQLRQKRRMNKAQMRAFGNAACVLADGGNEVRRFFRHSFPVACCNPALRATGARRPYGSPGPLLLRAPQSRSGTVEHSYSCTRRWP